MPRRSADVVLVHAGASELAALFARRAVRPLLLADDRPGSVTHAYAALKLLAQRAGLMAHDLLLAAAPHSPRAERIAMQLARCADDFLGAVLHDCGAHRPGVDARSTPRRQRCAASCATCCCQRTGALPPRRRCTACRAAPAGARPGPAEPATAWAT